MSQQKKSLCTFTIARCQILLEGSGGHKLKVPSITIDYHLLKSLISHIVTVS